MIIFLVRLSVFNVTHVSIRGGVRPLVRTAFVLEEQALYFM